MALNEADLGLPVVEGPRPGRHGRLPGSAAPAWAGASWVYPPLLAPASSPQMGAAAPLLSAGEWSGTVHPLCRAMGRFPCIFGGSLSSPCTAGKAPHKHSWKSQPCTAGPPPTPAQLERHPQAQLKNHLCISAAPGTAGRANQGTAGRVTPATLAHVGLPRASPKSTSSPAGPERGGRGLRAALAVNVSFSLFTGHEGARADLHEGAGGVAGLR